MDTDEMRDALEAQIIQDGISGDTTVLGELLTLLTDRQIFNALSDELQEKYGGNYMCQNCGGGFFRDEMVFGDDVDLCVDCSI